MADLPTVGLSSPSVAATAGGQPMHSAAAGGQPMHSAAAGGQPCPADPTAGGGQGGPFVVDWRALRQGPGETYNQGGLQARMRRNMARVQQQLMAEFRTNAGLPKPEGTLQDQVKNERLKYLAAEMREVVEERVRLEKAKASQAASSNQPPPQLAKAPSKGPLPPWCQAAAMPPPPKGQWCPPPPPCTCPKTKPSYPPHPKPHTHQQH